MRAGDVDGRFGGPAGSENRKRTMTTLMESPAITTVTNEETSTEDGPVAHIVKTEPGQDAMAVVTEARVYGTPIEALCGHVWVPSRDPKQLPMCTKCTEVYELYRMSSEDLNETPNM
jgi:hypothetical protein